MEKRYHYFPPGIATQELCAKIYTVYSAIASVDICVLTHQIHGKTQKTITQTMMAAVINQMTCIMINEPFCRFNIFNG